jgi:hypothetical protein
VLSFPRRNALVFLVEGDTVLGIISGMLHTCCLYSTFLHTLTAGCVYWLCTYKEKNLLWAAIRSLILHEIPQNIQDFCNALSTSEKVKPLSAFWVLGLLCGCFPLLCLIIYNLIYKFSSHPYVLYFPFLPFPSSCWLTFSQKVQPLHSCPIIIVIVITLDLVCI